MPRTRKAPPPLCPEPASAVDAAGTRFLRTLVGYKTHRASLVIIEVFMERMAVYGLKMVEFSVLSLVAHKSRHHLAPAVRHAGLAAVQPGGPDRAAGAARADRAPPVPQRRPRHGRAPDARGGWS